MNITIAIITGRPPPLGLIQKHGRRTDEKANGRTDIRKNLLSDDPGVAVKVE